MNWYYLQYNTYPGFFNMDLDLYYSDVCAENEVYFRLYRWKPFSISLGANQSYEIIDIEKAMKEDIGIVIRPTGGRAILHAEELTYSIIINTGKQISPHEFYREVNSALLKGLTLYDLRLGNAELETAQPNFRDIYKTPESTACFASPAKSEIKYSGKKLIGSAQLKKGNTILQHGSILTGTYHKRLPEFLLLDEKKREQIRNILSEKTIEIDTILGAKTDHDRLANCIKTGFENHFSISFQDKNIPISVPED